MAESPRWLGSLPEDMINRRDQKDARRLKTQTLSIAMQYIVDGIGFTTNWLEFGIPSSGSRYASFDVPAGFYMALDYRLLNPSGEEFWYHVYPEGTYTLNTETGNTATGKALTRNTRQDSAFTLQPVKRYTLSSAPTRFDDSIIDEPAWGSTGSSSGNKAEGALAPDSTFFLLSPDQQFLLELYNGGSGPSDAQLHLNYAFIPADKIPNAEV